MLCKLKGAGHCTSAKRMTSILRYVEQSQNSHRVIGIATNTSMVLNCALVTYIMMTADVGLRDLIDHWFIWFYLIFYYCQHYLCHYNIKCPFSDLFSKRLDIRSLKLVFTWITFIRIASYCWYCMEIYCNKVSLQLIIVDRASRYAL